MSRNKNLTITTEKSKDLFKMKSDEKQEITERSRDKKIMRQVRSVLQKSIHFLLTEQDDEGGKQV